MFLITYRTHIGQEKKELFEIQFIAEEFCRELNKQPLIKYCRMEKVKS